LIRLVTIKLTCLCISNNRVICVVVCVECNIGPTSFGFLRIPMDSYGFLCISMDSCGFLWIPVDSYGFLRIPTDSYGFLCILVPFTTQSYIHMICIFRSLFGSSIFHSLRLIHNPSGTPGDGSPTPSQEAVANPARKRLQEKGCGS
jgi:hypothetical protein